ncbi:MAG: hypothetical protein AUJ49_06365 [Desulfovibrionaceae bacterium CG1_02_65_16]|nr:MAG: hypothetical protein AUJ49_06365 [Desulfovibrionaceae bacterium CG1_02_65_16]
MGAATTNPCGARAPGLGGAGTLALVIGFLAGLVLYLPWDTAWDMALRRMTERLPGVRITWQSIDHASPLGFRVNGLVAGSPEWPVSPRAQWVEVRLGVSPRLSLRADTGGRELRLVCLDTGDFDLRGAANLACLGRRDILGSVEVRAEGRVDTGAKILDHGLLDLRGKALQLPRGLWLGDAVLALEYKDKALRIRNFTLREPMQVRAEGAAAIRPGALLASPYAVSGEIVRGREAASFTSEGQLGDFLGETLPPE